MDKHTLKIFIAGASVGATVASCWIFKKLIENKHTNRAMVEILADRIELTLYGPVPKMKRASARYHAYRNDPLYN